MRSRIFAEKDVHYKRAVELSQALEAAERHASMAGAAGAAPHDDGLHRIGIENKSSKYSNKNQFFPNGSDSQDEGCNFYNLVVSNNGDGPYYAKIKVENILCKFEIDTGSKLSVISKEYYYYKLQKWKFI
ncbi:unnamed protein product [Arctia plantaginis]|uniref:Uncharacterized protein n=1 Tax=Arctia plantaginis TaxID=874455 RepID=A0A8S1B363_ARCPL|nr:unnamed protein product [Arctia plantaginis]